jgi:hypothetical protein
VPCGQEVRSGSPLFDRAWVRQSAAMDNATDDVPATAPPEDEMEPRRWKRDGWIARVIKNEDDDGWAVEMTRVGDSEPSLVGPWTMGRDKKNPKPLDHAAFHTLVKTATEVLIRAETAAKNRLHRTVSCGDDRGRYRVDLDIARDEDDPHAIVAAFDDASGERIRSSRVSAGFKLTAGSALRFAQTGHTGEDR